MIKYHGFDAIWWYQQMSKIKRIVLNLLTNIVYVAYFQLYCTRIARCLTGNITLSVRQHITEIAKKKDFSSTQNMESLL